MVSYKPEYLICDEEREKLRKEVKKLREELGNAHLELRMCLKKEEKEEILKKAEEVSKMKAEEILKSEEFKERLWAEVENIIEKVFDGLADSYAERLASMIAETLEVEILKIMEKKTAKIKEIVKQVLEDTIYNMTV
jgi:predicted polyphosphate/ATP-dependent NAD kinase